MNLLRTVQRTTSGTRDITTLEDLSQQLSIWNPYGQDLYLGSHGPFTQTLTGEPAEEIPRTFRNYAADAMEANGVVFAVMLARLAVFSAARFRWQALRNGSPSDSFGTSELAVLERPWVGGTTQDLLGRMIQDVDLAGNAFITRYNDELVRMRPDWVDIVVQRRRYRGGTLGFAKIGYIYYEGGKYAADVDDIVPLLPDEVCHFMPLPDPQASYRGMSWLTPIIREVQSDGLMERHKRKFFENGATPSMIIKHNLGANPEKVQRFNDKLQEKYGGADNAYKTLNLYPGADVTVVGKDFQQIDFKRVQGAGETRIAAAGGVPPIIVGLSEGLESATYSNYAQARRRFGDATIHPLWQNASGSMEPLLKKPGAFGDGADVRLWYDVSGVPFLREDAKDQSDIASARATTIKTYVDAGFTPESAVAAVDGDDVRLLKHTGLVSVQLLPPGTTAAGNNGSTPPSEQGASA
jgi:phage portal protein BeeE